MVKGETRVVETTVTPVVGVGTRMSWGAVIAGLFVAIVAQLMMTLLGAAIGLGLVAAGADVGGPTTITIAAGAWLLTTGFVTYWIAGWVAGRMSGSATAKDGMWHGIVTWCVASVFMLYMLGTAAGAAVGGAASLLETGMQTPGMAGAVRAELDQMGINSQGVGPEVTLPLTQQPTAETQRQTAVAAAGGSQAAMWALIVLAVSGLGAALGGLKGAPLDRQPAAYVA